MLMELEYSLKQHKYLEKMVNMYAYIIHANYCTYLYFVMHILESVSSYLNPLALPCCALLLFHKITLSLELRVHGFKITLA